MKVTAPDVPGGTGPTAEHDLLCTAGPRVSLMFGARLLEAVHAAAERYGYRHVVIDHRARQVWGIPPVPDRRHLQAVPS